MHVGLMAKQHNGPPFTLSEPRLVIRLTPAAAFLPRLNPNNALQLPKAARLRKLYFRPASSRAPPSWVYYQLDAIASNVIEGVAQ